MPEERIYGIHAVDAALKRKAVSRLWLLRGRGDRRLEALAAEAARQGLTLQRLSREELDEMSGGAVHQGAMGEVQVAAPGDEQTLETLLDELAGPPFLLMLDGVQDPHNLGACLRSAAAAGVHAVIAPKDRAASLTPAARKVASGAAEIVPFIQVTNLARTLRDLKERGIWTVGLAGEADQPLYEIDLSGPLALVMGAEGSGLRRLTKEHCDFLARIPMTDAVASLNVSVSAGIGMFEAVRQRKSRDR
ncbi:MAG TPA: 23S rRNA (guanosine(2251)-2'-O)-methyltransferase RlmB [Gammaproteobacteria bacterium]|nr:23S rRNA (guanosine(2251)-2'-O)-methyltransferase RlmB [Gammaproteobacteria bacterium]